MAFIKKSEMKKKVLAVTIAEHPLLKTSDVDTSVKIAYLQGCTLAALFDDAEMSEDEKNRLTNIGLSLRLSENEISEAMSTVMSLSEDERMPFVDEIVGVLRVDPVADFFMDDFESVMSVNGKICGEAAEGLDFVGSLIYKDENWKVVRKKKQDAVRKEKERIEAAAAKKAAEEKAAKEKAEAERRKKEAEKRAKELNAKFFNRANELLSDYFNDNPLPGAAWRKMLVLREEGFDVVDIGEVIKSFQAEYDKAESEWHELQGNYSYRVVKSARVAISKRLAIAASALCAVKKDLCPTDISSLNGLKKISHSECGCFKMMSELKKRVSSILGWENDSDDIGGIFGFAKAFAKFK